MKTAALLVRVSTKDQSTESQEQALRVIATEMGYNPKFVFAEKITGKDKYDEDRKSLRDLKAAIKEGGIDAIFVWELSRLSRDPHKLIKLHKEFTDMGIPIYFNDLEVWTINPTTGIIDDVATTTIFNSANYGWTELKKIRARTMRGKNAKAKEGYCVGIKCYGYKIVTIGKEKRIEIEPKEAEIVQTIFEMYDSGNSFTYIMRWLIANNHKTQRGSEFKNSSISHILKQRWYIGESNYKGIKNTHTPIIDKALFERIRFKMDKPKRSKTNKRFYALSGLIECGCGKKLYANTIKKDAYYICGVRVGGECTNSINKFFVDGIVWGVIKHRLVDNENFDNLMSFFKLDKADEIKLQTDLDNTNTIINGLNKANKSLNNQLKSYYTDRANTSNKASKSALNDLIESTEKEIEKNEKLIYNYINEVNQIAAKIEGNKEIEKTFDNPIATINQLEDKDKIRELIHKIVSKVIIYRKEKDSYRIIRIVYTNGRSEDIIYNGRTMRGYYIHLYKGMYYDEVSGMVINPNGYINYDSEGYYIGKSDRKDTSYTNVLEGKEISIKDTHKALILAQKPIEVIE